VTEADFIAALRALPLHPGAHALRDDTATIAGLTVTTDTIVEGVHFLPDDAPADVAWKLVAVTLSDLAAKGAQVEGVLLNYPLSSETWDRAFIDGLSDALDTFDCALIGGDTVSLPANAPRVLTLTAIGRDAPAPPRSGARAGDQLWVTGTIGDAGAGLRIAQGASGPRALLARYRRPTPRLAEGRRLAPTVHAMMDMSDGLLIDAARMAAASGLAVVIELASLPLSPDYLAFAGADLAAHLAAATAGDDYELLFALPAGDEPPVCAFPVGRFDEGSGITLTWQGGPVPLPSRLGFQH
jgi:thiamine-monophosphate kinase